MDVMTSGFSITVPAQWEQDARRLPTGRIPSCLPGAHSCGSSHDRANRAKRDPFRLRAREAAYPSAEGGVESKDETTDLLPFLAN